MASIIEGYNYDIFISYRQKDNKGDRWVSEFVEALKIELESTFKEEISIYFDINPHDGLLETHDVDESLKEKLKCLIFIPIISRTYCDPKSFAWEHEFKEFIEHTQKDRFGLKVKLPGGNVANRVLPVQIHDLDLDDKKLFENELGGFIRGIEFIYKEPGVNKPLTSKDDEKKNLNNTKYEIQVNKVANAIKEIITGLTKSSSRGKEALKGIDDVGPSGRKNQVTKVISGSLIIMVLIMAGYFILSNLVKTKNTIEKSIAVLPFKLLSDEPDKQYLADGMMEAITLHLSRIKDLRVQGRTSTEQYRNSSKTTTAIGKELGVHYLLEGSFQKFGDNVKLIVRLIRAGKEGNVWANDYDRNWSDIFKVQSEVAQKVASELQAAITPEEKQLIEKIPTTNLTAYDYFQMGREAEEKYSFYDMIVASTDEAYIFNNPSSSKFLDRAEKMYNKALESDSTFAPAYTALAGIYWSRNYYREYFSENFLDSVLILTTKALSFDDKLSDAYYIRGKYYGERGDLKKAIEDFDRSILLNPNFWLAYYVKGAYYAYENDYVAAIQNLLEAASRNHGSGLPEIYRRIVWTLNGEDQKELIRFYNREAAKLESDSTKFYYWSYLNEDDPQKRLDFLKKGFKIDPRNILIIGGMSEYYESVKQYKEAIRFFKEYFDELKETGSININNMHRIGYCYYRIGQKDSADYYFNKQLEYCNNAIRLGRIYGVSSAHYDIAGVYAFKGDRIKAYENLRIFNKQQKISGWIAEFLKIDPLFESIRNEPEFQKISKEVEEKSKGPLQELKKWLEEIDML